MTESQRAALFAELYRDYQPKLLRLCRGYLAPNGPQADADDLFQEIMLRVWNHLPAFRHQSQPGTWLYRIAVNTALLYRRKTTAYTHQIAKEPFVTPPDERLLILTRLLKELPSQDRILVTLFLEGLSYKEIAEILGISVNLTGVRLNRIKHALEQRWKELANHDE